MRARQFHAAPSFRQMRLGPRRRISMTIFAISLRGHYLALINDERRTLKEAINY